jgi:HPt (histidine-containing phosphotransfer) domain-containing protein
MNTDSTLPPDNGNPKAGRLFAATGKITAWMRRTFDLAGTGSSTQDSLQTVPGEHPPCDMGDDFSSEMFVQLLLELPAHRRDIAESLQAGDLQRLRNCVHRLLGAVVYCDAPELEDALRELRRALHTGDAASIALQHARALDVIDTTLSCSGCR